MQSPESTLSERVERLENFNQTICQENAQMKAQFHADRLRLRVQLGLSVFAVAGAIFLSPGNRTAIAQGYGVTLSSLAARITAVETKTCYLSVDKPSNTMLITGANLQIVNGLGATNGYPTDPTSTDPSLTQVNGLGNLIVGYNDGDSGSYFRGGSHNLVLGSFNQYGSFGGSIMGSYNNIAAAYSTVTGGQKNTSYGICSSISGGSYNQASDPFSSVSGGILNRARSTNASVTGGYQNTVDGFYSCISGGVNNHITSYFSVICGGEQNLASGNVSSVIGGGSATASGGGSLVAGGYQNTASALRSVVGGGSGVTQSNTNGWAAGPFHSP